MFKICKEFINLITKSKKNKQKVLKKDPKIFKKLFCKI